MFSCPNRAYVCDGTCPDCPRLKIARTMKYVFLDVDGVLNSKWHLANMGEPVYADKLSPTDYEIGINQIHKELVLRLNGLVERDVVFVLSSAWRRWFNYTVMQEMLQQLGFQGQIIGATPTRLSESTRGSEIATWLEENTGVELERGERAWPVFIILDDNDDMDRPRGQTLRGRLVRTSYENGLQDEHIARARRMLGLSPRTA